MSETSTDGSEETSENELMERSLSVWKGWSSVDAEDFTPFPLDLHTASSIGHYEFVRGLILQNGRRDLDRKNQGGWTPLMYASYIGHDSVVNLLVNAGCQLDMRNPRGHTPLILAASCGNETVARTLVRNGSSIEITDHLGWTALFHATYAGHQNFVAFLLDAGANMEAVETASGRTPFMEAAAAGHEIIVQLFLQHGVNITAKSFSGHMARSLALSNGYMKVVSLIDNYLFPDASIRSEAGLEDYLVASMGVEGASMFSATPKAQGPSIRDGPDAIARMIDRSRDPGIPANYNMVPNGYMSFPPDFGDSQDRMFSYRDVTSPIGPDDCTDNCSTEDSYEESSAFTKTGAITIKSSSSSSGGLVAVLGLSRESSTDSENELDLNSRQSHEKSLNPNSSILNKESLNIKNHVTESKKDSCELPTVYSNHSDLKNLTISDLTQKEKIHHFFESMDLKENEKGAKFSKINQKLESHTKYPDSKTISKDSSSQIHDLDLQKLNQNQCQSSENENEKIYDKNFSAIIYKDNQNSKCLKVDSGPDKNIDIIDKLNKTETESSNEEKVTLTHEIKKFPEFQNNLNFNSKTSFTNSTENEKNIDFTVTKQPLDLELSRKETLHKKQIDEKNMQRKEINHCENQTKINTENKFKNLDNNHYTCNIQNQSNEENQIKPHGKINPDLREKNLDPSKCSKYTYQEGLKIQKNSRSNQSDLDLHQKHPVADTFKSTSINKERQDSVLIPGHSKHQPVSNYLTWTKTDKTDHQFKDLEDFLTRLGLTKYLDTFLEQDIDLQVFLSLTNDDLKELGVKLFGPRKKMTNAIARWHSKAPPVSDVLEQAYADRLDAELQETASHLTRSYEVQESLKNQVSQEQQLRAVTESYLLKERSLWEEISSVFYTARKELSFLASDLNELRKSRNESINLNENQILSSTNKEIFPKIPPTSLNTPSSFTKCKTTNTDQNLTTGDLRKFEEIFSKTQALFSTISMETDRLFGNSLSFSGKKD